MKKHSIDTIRWRRYFSNTQESFFQRLDRVITELNHDAPEIAKIEWIKKSSVLEEENARRRFVQKKLALYMSSKTVSRWIPFVRETVDGQWEEFCSELIDPGLSSSERETRDNILKACAALQLNGNQTTKVLNEVFFSRYFNLKNLFELVCHFYTSSDPFEKNWYKKAQNFIEMNNLDEIPCQKPDDTIFTEEILKRAFLDEQELLSYIKDNSALFAKENQLVMAKDCIDVDIELCWKLAIQEVRSKEADYYAGDLAESERKKPFDPNQIEMAKLLQIIVGHTIERKLPISKYDSVLLPSKVVKNFPTAAILINIQNETSLDRVRKALILLVFYIAAQTTNNGNACREMIDGRLRDANLPELCDHDLYDALFIYAMSKNDPLTAFRNIMLDAKPQ